MTKINKKYINKKYINKTHKKYKTNRTYKKYLSKQSKQKQYKGGSCGLSSLGQMPSNINGVNHTIPNTGPLLQPSGTIFSSSTAQRGGMCSCNNINGGGNMSEYKGGMCPCMLAGLGLLGGKKHKKNCKCVLCLAKRENQRTRKYKTTNNKYSMNGGNNLFGLSSKYWQPSNPGNGGNYYELNKYSPVDISRSIKALGGNPPFDGKNNMKGGNYSNSFFQDLQNTARQVQYGIGTTYNNLRGYSPPVNPLPFKDQLNNKLPFI